MAHFETKPCVFVGLEEPSPEFHSETRVVCISHSVLLHPTQAVVSIALSFEHVGRFTSFLKHTAFLYVVSEWRGVHHINT